MSGSKNFDKVAWIVTALMLVVTILFMNGASIGIEIMAHNMGYENRLFDNTRVHTIDIVMNDWDEFIANATSEEYYTASMVIDGEAYKNVAIRGKGNTSLSNVASMDSDRYSFKVEFDHYDSSITYHGLDKLSLNNLIQDSTMMKDYLTYTMMNEFGVHSSLCSFVYITVNGEDWGLYLAVEGVEDSFLERNYGSNYGELYKPDSMSMGGGRGNGKDFNMDDFANNDETADSSGESEQNTNIPQIPGMQGGAMPDMGGLDPSGMQGGNMPDMGNVEPSQMQGDFGGENIPQMPGMTQDGAETGNMPSFDGGRSDFSFSLDEETLREAFEKLELDQSLLDDVDFANITMETMQSVLSSLDEETLQKLMQEIMGSASFDRNVMGGEKGGMDNMGMGSSDVKLQYIDDNTSSYSNIWNNAKTDISEADQTRLIESLEKLSNGEQIESVVDIEQVIRYFVVHNYVCNGDSYTGSMIHNYYLYEENGQMAMIPWDYNLAYGTFQGNNAQSTVNTPIDSPVDGGSSEDRPMWNWIVSSEEYTKQYHQYFAEFLNTVDIEGIIDNAYNLIKPYVEKDPTAFYTYEEFEAGVETIRQFCTLRSESISMQLANGETMSNMSYVDASGITLSDMGTMNMGGGGDMDRRNSKGDRNNMNEDMQMPSGENVPEMPSGGMANGNMQEGSIPTASEGDGAPQMPDGIAGQGVMGEKPSDLGGNTPPSGVSSAEPGNVMGAPETSASSNANDTASEDAPFEGNISDSSSSTGMTAPSGGNDSFRGFGDRNMQDRGEMTEQIQVPDMGNMGHAGDFSAGQSSMDYGNLIWLGVSIGILIVGLIIAALFKKR